MYGIMSNRRDLNLFRLLLVLVFAELALCRTCVQANLNLGLGMHDITSLDNVSTADATGSYWVGITIQTYCADNRNLTVSICPVVSSGGIVGKAYEDAPLDSSDGPYPLVLFSAGLGAVNDAYYFYLQNLASYGYIVTSAQHADAREAATTTNEALLVIAAAEALLADTNDAEIKFNLNQTILSNSNSSSKFYGAIGTENIGMTGHSLGGYYTNIIGGGAPIYCDFVFLPGEDDPNNPLLADVSPCAFPEHRDLSDPFGFQDTRIKAIIPLAAPSFITKDQISRSAAEIQIPVMVMTGDNFTSETTQWIQEAIFNNARGPSYYVEIVLKGPEDTEIFLDKAAVYMTYSAAFFDYYIKGNTSALEILHET
ncbi:Alpha/Beta hydrolase protein [Xylariaceae sp. FL0255]|nr:Alpha/Beta hydrolase protein [Xylariaceae sp. FL0255]